MHRKARVLSVILVAALMAACHARDRDANRIRVLQARVNAMQIQLDKMKLRQQRLKSRIDDLDGMLVNLSMLARSTAPAPKPAPESSVPVPHCRKTATGYVLTPAAWKTILLDEGAKLDSTFRVVPDMAGGDVRGFSLFAIQPGSLIASCGFENDDVVETVNGMSITTPEHAFDVWTQLPDASRVAIRLLRHGKPMQLVITRSKR